LIVLIVLLFLTGPLQYMPEAVLATVVLLIGIQLVDIHGLIEIYRARKEEFLVAVITAVVVVIVGVEQGIVLAFGADKNGAPTDRDDDPAVRIVNLDLLTYAGNLESLSDVFERRGPTGDGRHFFIRADVRDFDVLRAVLAGEATETPRGDAGAAGPAGRRVPAPDAVVHMAAESHVDRSIMGPAVFVDTNVRGTVALLEACRAELVRAPRPFRLLHVSTDEVYGSLGERDAAFTEATPLARAPKFGCLPRAARS
jgi:hypothetical protein